MQPASCVSRLQVNLHCVDLPNRNAVRLPDAFAVLYIDNRVRPGQGASSSAPVANNVTPPSVSEGAARGEPWVFVGSTECISQCRGPRWAKSFEIAYFFERAQRIVVDVYDQIDSRDNSLSRQTLLGSLECRVSQLVRARGQRFREHLTCQTDPEARFGEIIIVVEEVEEIKKEKEMIGLDVSLLDAERRRFREPLTLHVLRINVGSYSRQCSTSDSVSQESAGGEWIVVSGPTKVSSSSQETIRFEEIQTKFHRFCLQSMDTKLHFELRDGGNAVVGHACSTLGDWREKKLLPLFWGNAREMSNGLPMSSSSSSSGSSSGRRSFLDRARDRLRLPSRPPAAQAVSEGSRQAQLSLNNYRKFTEHTFYDYIRCGHEINLIVAIDFTASNGDPSKAGTLHYRDPHRRNEYELAIKSVGDILAAYDTDSLIPSYGFGAITTGNASVSHCFSLTGHANANCDGIRGVLIAYRETLLNVQFCGPTVFSNVIDTAMRHVREGSMSEIYTILLILTDGVINDTDETYRKIAEASHLPISIVIIGIGNEDFGDMIKLDGDRDPIPDCERDIVQFVPFRTCQDAPEVLAENVLEEIPLQVRRRHVLSFLALFLPFQLP